jgi:protein NRD1
MINTFRTKLENPSAQTYTPPGEPPKQSAPPSFPINPPSIQPPSSLPPPPDPSVFLATMASMQPQFGNTPSTNAQAIQTPSANPIASYTHLVGNIPTSVPPVPMPMPPTQPNALAPSLGATSNVNPSSFAANQQAVNMANANPLLGQLFEYIKTNPLPPDQLTQVLAVIMQQSAGSASSAAPVAPVPLAQAAPAPPYDQSGSVSMMQNANVDYSRQNGGHDAYSRRNERRSRSRSPNRHPGSPPQRRDSPDYAAYDPRLGSDGNTFTNNSDRGRGKNKGYRNEYRQRSPPNGRNAASQNDGVAHNPTRFLQIDRSLKRGCIKGSAVLKLMMIRC